MAAKQSAIDPLSLQNISTRRGQFALEVDSLQLPAGKIACVVGPNGGGKTTLLLTALGLLPHAGQVKICGQNFDGTQPALKAKIGFVPDDPEMLFTELTGRECWHLTANVLAGHGAGQIPQLEERAEELSITLSFDPPAKLTKNYSHGMRKKTQIVNALLATPPLIVMDELRNGLDPIAIKQAEDLMRTEKARGAAILAATHDLWWAERFADYIYILRQGKIVASGSLKQLLKKGEQHLEQAFFRIMADGV
jgi:ABC-2 type transport system ATP-binding protein